MYLRALLCSEAVNVKRCIAPGFLALSQVTSHHKGITEHTYIVDPEGVTGQRNNPEKWTGVMGGSGGLRVALLHSPQIIRIVHQVNAQLFDALTNARLRKRAHFRFP